MIKGLIRPGKDSEDIPTDIPVVLVTPELAEEWLATRFDNERVLRQGKVSSFARDMQQGKWYFTGDTIRFDKETGQLLDGQHRLSAVALSKCAQWFPILNIPEEARAGIDTGSARTLGDLLQIGNHIHGRELAAIVRRVLIYRDGLQGSTGGKYVPTHAEGVEFVEANGEALLDSLKFAHQAHKNRVPASPSAIGAAHFVCARSDKAEADRMFTRVVTGNDIQAGDPAGALRNRFMRYQVNNGRPLPADDVFRFAILAYNVSRRGGSIERLQVPRGGWNANNVPVPE